MEVEQAGPLQEAAPVPQVAVEDIDLGAEFRMPGRDELLQVTAVAGTPPVAFYCPATESDPLDQSKWEGPLADLNALQGWIASRLIAAEQVA